MRFEVIPEAGRENQMYIAFRISDVNGLVPSDDMTGRPVVMEIQPQAVEQVEAKRVNAQTGYYSLKK